MSECDHEPLIMMRPWSTMGCSAIGGGADCPIVIVSRLGAGDSVFEYQQGQKIFSFPKSSRQALGSTQLPKQWVPGLFPGVYSGRSVKLTTQLHLVPRL